jgi:hypothetical protein
VIPDVSVARMPWLGCGCNATDTAGGMTIGEGGGSCVTLGGGSGSREGAGMGGQGAVAPAASWGLAALAVTGKCHSLGPVSSCQAERIG